MHDRRNGGRDRDGGEHEHHREDGDCDGGPEQGGAGDGGGGPDTRFLQLEMSRVLYADAEAVARPALRELLLEAAKQRLRERFGQTIDELARLAVDELLDEVMASLEIEGKIRARGGRGEQTQERLREIFARLGAGDEPGAPERERPAPRGRSARSRRRG